MTLAVLQTSLLGPFTATRVFNTVHTTTCTLYKTLVIKYANIQMLLLPCTYSIDNFTITVDVTTKMHEIVHSSYYSILHLYSHVISSLRAANGKSPFSHCCCKSHSYSLHALPAYNAASSANLISALTSLALAVLSPTSFLPISVQLQDSGSSSNHHCKVHVQMKQNRCHGIILF